MSNPLDIVWPQDQFGNLSALKRAGLAAVKNFYGSEEKRDAFMRTLRVLADHANARYTRQKAERDALTERTVETDETSE